MVSLAFFGKKKEDKMMENLKGIESLNGYTIKYQEE
jgi:hypothetical protein